MDSKRRIHELQRVAQDVRADILQMIPPGKVSHLGGSCSIADIAAALYFEHMHVFDDPKDPARDRLVFSKGHAVLAQYACLVELGYVDRAELARVKTLGGTLQGHPDMELRRASRRRPAPWGRGCRYLWAWRWDCGLLAATSA